MNYIEKFKEYPLTYSLMLINSVIFIVPELIISWHEPLHQAFALSGHWVFRKDELYRVFTSVFLHNNAMHIVLNMLSLYIVGTMVEKLFSKVSYLSIYFISAFFGSFTSIYFHLDGWAVGASGAIFGLFGALAGFAFVHRNTMREQFISFMKNFGLVLVINLVIGIIVPNIDISAHIGGLIVGVIGGFIIAKQRNFVWIYLIVSLSLLWAVHSYIYTLYAYH